MKKKLGKNVNIFTIDLCCPKKKKKHASLANTSVSFYDSLESYLMNIKRQNTQNICNIKRFKLLQETATKGRLVQADEAVPLL